MIDPDHSMFRTYREDTRMSHIPYYDEDEKNTDTKKSTRDVKQPSR